jgi:hypothetical protein
MTDAAMTDLSPAGLSITLPGCCKCRSLIAAEGAALAERGAAMNVTDAPPHEPFKHYCHCGKWASFGYGVKLHAGVDGKWFCREHRPRRGAATTNITITRISAIEAETAPSIDDANCNVVMRTEL